MQKIIASLIVMLVISTPGFAYEGTTSTECLMTLGKAVRTAHAANRENTGEIRVLFSNIISETEQLVHEPCLKLDHLSSRIDLLKVKAVEGDLQRASDDRARMVEILNGYFHQLVTLGAKLEEKDFVK